LTKTRHVDPNTAGGNFGYDAAGRLTKAFAPSNTFDYAFATNATRGQALRPEECEWHDGHTIRAAIGEVAGVEENLVGESMAELVVEPVEVADVVVGRRFTEFDLDRDDPSVFSLDNEIDFAIRFLGPQVPDPCERRPGVDAHTLRSKGLEQGTQPCTGCTGGPLPVARQETLTADADQTRRQRWVNKVVLRRAGESLQWVERRDPGFDRVEHENPGKVVSVSFDGRPGRLVGVAARRRIQDFGVRRVRGGRCTVCRKPRSQRLRASDAGTVLREFLVHDSGEVRIELNLPGPLRETTDPWESGRKDLVSIGRQSYA
jgi:hypothetical protein